MNVQLLTDRELTSIAAQMGDELSRRDRLRGDKPADPSPTYQVAQHAETTPGPSAGRVTIDNVEDAFTYQPWHAKQTDAGQQVREALVAAAKTILRLVPDGPMRTRAINDLIDARMKANAAISFSGRF